MTEFRVALVLVDDWQRFGLRQVGDKWEFPLEPTTGQDPRQDGHAFLGQAFALLVADAAIQMPGHDRTVYVYVGRVTLDRLEYFSMSELLQLELTEEAKEIVRITLGQ
jgi:hypothetical protein